MHRYKPLIHDNSIHAGNEVSVYIHHYMILINANVFILYER